MREESTIRVAAPQAPKPRNATPEQPRSKRTRRRSGQSASHGPSARFFLSKGEGNGVPLLEREFKTESEAMIESLKSGKSYFVVSEWRAMADIGKKTPQIQKEPVKAKSS